ncbi:MAG TPA: hypothetical protein VL307_10565 [Chitinophagaceae bacterium]|nr:hypothetical protein [Chitinophagaceae bacterium]
MKRTLHPRLLFAAIIVLLHGHCLQAQTQVKLKYDNSAVYAGIEVGAKGVKMSILEIGKDAKQTGSFAILKDTSINTDFISFLHPNFQATLNGMYGLYNLAVKEYRIAPKRVFTVVSSGVKMQAEKENKKEWITNLVDSFKLRTKEAKRVVEVVDIMDEARLSHLGIVPDNDRYNTFLIDIGSGNTKGGYFPNGNTKDFKLFGVNWGTKSTTTATEKKCGDDKSLATFYKQLAKTATEAENTGIIYAVNESGAYPKSDNIAFSGGIAWSVATLLHPEMYERSTVPVTYDEVAAFCEKIYTDYSSFSDFYLVKNIKNRNMDLDAVSREIKRVHQVFDQRSLMGGSRLLLKIMRQFESVNEKKEFFLVKNGQVGWVSAYVDKEIMESN